MAEVSPAEAVCGLFLLPLISVLLIGRILDSRGRFHWQNLLHRMTFKYAIFQAAFGFFYWFNLALWCCETRRCR
jgi:hypothetical protein